MPSSTWTKSPPRRRALTGGLEAAFAELDQHHLALAAVDHRRGGHGNDRRLAADGDPTSAYMAGLSRPPGLASSMRTGTVRVSAFSMG